MKNRVIIISSVCALLLLLSSCASLKTMNSNASLPAQTEIPSDPSLTSRKSNTEIKGKVEQNRTIAKSLDFGRPNRKEYQEFQKSITTEPVTRSEQIVAPAAESGHISKDYEKRLSVLEESDENQNKKIAFLTANQIEIDAKVSDLIFPENNQDKIRPVVIRSFAIGKTDIDGDMEVQLKSAVEMYNGIAEKLERKIELRIYGFSDKATGTSEVNSEKALSRAQNGAILISPLLSEDVTVKEVIGVGSSETALYPQNERCIRIYASFVNNG